MRHADTVAIRQAPVSQASYSPAGSPSLKYDVQPALISVLTHGSLLVKYYAPKEIDQQTPHTRDELYVVIQGSGWFVCGDQRYPFGVSDVLFVPAGVVHRFEDFTDDFCVWVVFYGPEGGETER